MNAPQISVDAQGNTVVSLSTPISEHCKSRARLLASLVNMVAAPGGFEQFSHFPDPMKRDILALMHSIVEEQLPGIEALEQHTAQSYYERGVNAAAEHYRKTDQPASIEMPQPLDYSQQR
ncbi:hypothetical protein AWB79_05361 [Caballeronia hypogeia]|uniref:Uncharacterized protein n=1 Tax=Caballeronia hypogeia TaxID=1777140 RepID=A0A158CGX4_9BURK|nr:hypothetical protein [Caballeronia hypogeia]SAK81559.1 hypothetical protein AWB79_05361 [Caballeronia hypogeia]